MPVDHTVLVVCWLAVSDGKENKDSHSGNRNTVWKARL